MSEINWTPLYKKYKGQWVALAQDEVTVISHGKNAKTVWSEAIKKVSFTPVLLKIPTKNIAYIG